MMVFTPKLALITTAVLVAVGLLWLGFVESGRSQATITQGIGTQGFVAAAPSHSQLIAAEAMPVSHPEDNVAAFRYGAPGRAVGVQLALNPQPRPGRGRPDQVHHHLVADQRLSEF